MTFKLLDTVVLNHDRPQDGLRRGDIGTIVHVHIADAYQVEFVSAARETAALLTLQASDLRAVASNDMMSVRPLDESS